MPYKVRLTLKIERIAASDETTCTVVRECLDRADAVINAMEFALSEVGIWVDGIKEVPMVPGEIDPDPRPALAGSPVG